MININTVKFIINIRYSVPSVLLIGWLVGLEIDGKIAVRGAKT